MASGEDIDIFCAVMEEDDGSQMQYQKVGIEILKIAKIYPRFSDIQAENFKNILAKVASINHLKNADDWIGAFTVLKGTSVGERKTKMNNPNNSKTTPNTAITNSNGSTYKFSGDGSYYSNTIQIK